MAAAARSASAAQVDGSSKRRATCLASASIAPAVSVVKSTSRVRSNSRVTSLRLAIASDARACAAADKLLAEAPAVNGTRLVIGALPAGPKEQVQQQADRLRQMGCFLGQGWYFARELTVEQSTAALRELTGPAGHTGEDDAARA